MKLTEADAHNIVNIQNGGSPIPAATNDDNDGTSDDSNGTANNGATGGAVDDPVIEQDEPDYLDLEELGFKSKDEVTASLKRFKELERENQELSEYKAGPKFKNDQQKLLYDFASRFDGMELSQARQLLELVDLKPRLDSLADHQVRFEAFKLDPELKGLSQDDIQKLFIDHEIKTYGNPDDEVNPQTEAQKIRARQATAKAKETILKVVNDWDNARPAEVDPKEVARQRDQYRQFVTEQLSSFDGINLTLAALDEKGEKLEGALNYKLEADQRAEIAAAIANPAGWWDTLLEQRGIVGKDGSLDSKKFAQLVSQIMYGDKIQNEVYKQGRIDQLSDKLKNARNVSDPSINNGASPEPSKLGEKSQAAEAFVRAIGLK
jgi:hypothetical protein